MITMTTFAQQHMGMGINGDKGALFSGVDVMKIDAESQDLAVVNGSLPLLLSEKGVGVLTWENGLDAHTTHFLQVLSSSKYTYECYSIAGTGFYKLTSGCISREVLGTTNWGNIFCVSKRIAPAVVLVFDAMSFYHNHSP